MARLESDLTLNSRITDGNIVERSVPYSDTSVFPTNTRLKDSVFFSFSKAEYSRKYHRIYQFSYGSVLSGTSASDVGNTDFDLVIHNDRDCSRFIPVVYPFTQTATENSRLSPPTGTLISETDLYDNAYVSRKFRNFKFATSNGYDLPESEIGYGVERTSFLTKWNYRKWAVCPVLVGIYGNASATSFEGIIMGNAIAVSDYFIDPSTYPTTLTGYSGYSLIGFSLCYYLAGNLGDNTKDYGRSLFNDCGVEINLSKGTNIMGAGSAIYGEATSQNTVTIQPSENGVYAFVSAGTLLGLSPQFGANFANDFPNLSYVYSSPFARNQMYTYGGGYNPDTNYTRIMQFSVVGKETYLDWSPLTYHLANSYSYGTSAGRIEEHEINSFVPIIHPDFIKEDFLLKVASQLGLPVIGSRANVETFMSSTNLDNVFNTDWMLIPKINLDTGEVEDENPTPSSQLPQDDERRKLLTEENPLDVVNEMDTSDLDPNKYTEETPLNDPTITPMGKFNRYFAISESDIEDFIDFLYTNNTSAITQILDGLKLNGENPMNFLIGLRMFPFNIVDYATVTAENITFGNGVDTGIVGEKIDEFRAVIDLGSCTFRTYYKNFLDYEPYTTAKIYIPYCNELEVPTSVFVGHTINVRLIVDITTGACTGVVFKDGIACLYTNGTIGCEIPITGANATEYVKTGIDVANKTVSAITQIATSGAQIGKTTFTEMGSTGTSGARTVGGRTNITETANTSNSTITTKQVNAPGIVGGIMSGLQTAYEFNHMPTPLQTNGTSTPNTNLYKPQKCYFIIEQAIPMKPSGYGDIIGYACMEHRKLNDKDNYIVAHNPQVQPSTATKQETDELNMLLATGVWI